MTDNDWQPTATWEQMRFRARLLADIRDFFRGRGVMEVETPILSAAATVESHLAPLETRYHGPGAQGRGRYYLHTSPEFPMKRLLAAGSGPIYQICHVFRDGEAGGRHNPEFTLLEWYRPGLDHLRLMDEVEALLHAVAGASLPPAERITYRQAFLRHAGIDPFGTRETLRDHALASGIAPIGSEHETDIDFWRDLILVHQVEPHLGQAQPCFIHDYPASQASLARVRAGDPAVAERFELYWRGFELANGFHELGDPVEQGRRFEADGRCRRQRGLPEVRPDRRLIAALNAGLPECAGVALGIDRLQMALTGARRIEEVIAFPVDRA